MSTLDLAEQLFERENIPFKKIIDPGLAFRRSRGLLTPTLAKVLTAYPGTDRETTILSVYDAVAFIDRHGLRKLA